MFHTPKSLRISFAITALLLTGTATQISAFQGTDTYCKIFEEMYARQEQQKQIAVQNAALEACQQKKQDAADQEKREALSIHHNAPAAHTSTLPEQKKRSWFKFPGFRRKRS